MNRVISSSLSTTTQPFSLCAKLLSNKMSAVKKVSHVIFDMDGLLLDTEPLYTDVYQKILDIHAPGAKFTWEVKLKLMGSRSEESARAMVSEYNLPITWEEFADEVHSLNRDIMKTAQLLPDTEHIYEGLVRDIAKMHNKTYPWNVRMRILGTTEQMTAKIAVNELHLPITVDEFKAKFSELGRKRLANVTLLKGAERLIRHLHETNVPFCLATSSSKEMAEIKMSRHQELFSLFNHKVMGSTDPDVRIGKPAPDIFLVAAKRFPDSPDPIKCLVFEDAPNGVRAACLAGMQSVMVPDKNVAQELREEATIVIDSLEQFEPELFGLPPFKDSA